MKVSIHNSQHHGKYQQVGKHESVRISIDGTLYDIVSGVVPGEIRIFTPDGRALVSKHDCANLLIINGVD